MSDLCSDTVMPCASDRYNTIDPTPCQNAPSTPTQKSDSESRGSARSRNENPSGSSRVACTPFRSAPVASTPFMKTSSSLRFKNRPFCYRSLHPDALNDFAVSGGQAIDKTKDRRRRKKALSHILLRHNSRFRDCPLPDRRKGTCGNDRCRSAGESPRQNRGRQA